MPGVECSDPTEAAQSLYFRPRLVGTYGSNSAVDINIRNAVSAAGMMAGNFRVIPEAPDSVLWELLGWFGSLSVLDRSTPYQD